MNSEQEKKHGSSGYPNLTEDQVAAALIKHRGVQARAAASLKVSRMAISHWCKGNERLQAIIEDARQARVDKAERNLEDFLDSRDISVKQRATEYVLDTIGKQRGYTKRQEIAPTSPIPVHFDQGAGGVL